MDAKFTLELLRALISQLSVAQRTELREVVAGLPAGVLGDEAARASTRVLVDVYDDAAASVAAERTALPRAHLERALAAAERLEPLAAVRVDGPERDQLVAALLGPPLAPPDRYRVTLQQLVLSKLIPADAAKRALFLEDLFTLPLTL